MIEFASRPDGPPKGWFAVTSKQASVPELSGDLGESMNRDGRRKHCRKRTVTAALLRVFRIECPLHVVIALEKIRFNFNDFKIAEWRTIAEGHPRDKQ